MFAKFIDVIQTFLTEPAILIGLLVGIGYALDKKSPIKIIKCGDKQRKRRYQDNNQRHGGINDGVIWWFPVFRNI